jgi:hypothetical protein
VLFGCGVLFGAVKVLLEMQLSKFVAGESGLVMV